VQLPIPGQPFSTEGVKVGNDIQTIAQWGNGHILGTDLDPAAGILPAQLDVSAQAPVGVIFQFAGRSAIPTGYALCDGRTLNRSDFPRGFDFATAEVAASNPLWTVNAGAATFTVPNFTNRFVYAGASASVGGTGGEATHALTAAESGVNGSGVTGADAPDHAHGNAQNGPGLVQGGSGAAANVVVGGAAYSLNNTGGATVRHAHPLQARNADAAHNNMPPYVVLALIVRVL
jgi:hypothetical protein